MACIGIALKPINLAWPKSEPCRVELFWVDGSQVPLLMEALVSADIEISNRKAVIHGSS